MEVVDVGLIVDLDGVLTGRERRDVVAARVREADFEPRSDRRRQRGVRRARAGRRFGGRRFGRRRVGSARSLVVAPAAACEGERDNRQADHDADARSGHSDPPSLLR